MKSIERRTANGTLWNRAAGVDSRWRQHAGWSTPGQYGKRREANIFKGNPISVSKAFFRMLYFSAIVLTTVGFGDIVPMTLLARSFVAIQAIFGIMLAGLFLNAIAHRASRS
jgi:hypothetical protein